MSHGRFISCFQGDEGGSECPSCTGCISSTFNSNIINMSKWHILGGIFCSPSVDLAGFGDQLDRNGKGYLSRVSYERIWMDGDALFCNCKGMGRVGLGKDHGFLCTCAIYPHGYPRLMNPMGSLSHCSFHFCSR